MRPAQAFCLFWPRAPCSIFNTFTLSPASSQPARFPGTPLAPATARQPPVPWVGVGRQTLDQLVHNTLEQRGRGRRKAVIFFCLKAGKLRARGVPRAERLACRPFRIFCHCVPGGLRVRRRGSAVCRRRPAQKPRLGNSRPCVGLQKRFGSGHRLQVYSALAAFATIFRCVRSAGVQVP